MRSALCASAPSHPLHVMPPRITRNSDRPRASDRTMVDTPINQVRLPSFKTRLVWSPPEDETHGKGKQARAKPLERNRGALTVSGLDLETKIFSASGRGRIFFLTSLFIELIDPDRPILNECNRLWLLKNSVSAPNKQNLGDRKCLGDLRKSLVGLPDAISFLRISREGVFQQPRLSTTIFGVGDIIDGHPK